LCAAPGFLAPIFCFLRPSRLDHAPRRRPTLSDVREPTLTLVCEPCGQRGLYCRERLIAEHGADMKLTDLLVTLAGWCQGALGSIHDRCQARYVRYYG
jgi:hypothetical protein